MSDAIAPSERQVADFLAWLDAQPRGIGNIAVTKGNKFVVSRAFFAPGKLSLRAGKAETAYERTPAAALQEMDAVRAFKSKPYEWLSVLLTNRR
jgi:hypothetical protein